MLELTDAAIDTAERTTPKMLWSVRTAAERARPDVPEAFRKQILTHLGAFGTGSSRTNLRSRPRSVSAGTAT